MKFLDLSWRRNYCEVEINQMKMKRISKISILVNLMVIIIIMYCKPVIAQIEIRNRLPLFLEVDSVSSEFDLLPNPFFIISTGIFKMDLVVNGTMKLLGLPGKRWLRFDILDSTSSSTTVRYSDKNDFQPLPLDAYRLYDCIFLFEFSESHIDIFLIDEYGHGKIFYFRFHILDRTKLTERQLYQIGKEE